MVKDKLDEMTGPTKAQLLKMAKKFGLTHKAPKAHKPIKIVRGPNGKFMSTKPPHEQRPRKPKVPAYNKFVRDLSNPNAPAPTTTQSCGGYGGPLPGGGGPPRL
jgi:hypothetical protein